MAGREQQHGLKPLSGRSGWFSLRCMVILLIMSGSSWAGTPAPVSLAKLAQEPEHYLGQEIVVEGVLTARGRTMPPQFLLQADSGATLAVTPWAPVEVYLPRQGKAGVKSMAAFVGKRWRLTGQLTREHGELLLKVSAAEEL
jgi:hypothetical protein